MSNDSGRRDADLVEMPDNPPPLSRAHAERLLAGGADDDFGPLSAVLAAAAAPGGSVAPEGLSVAVAAFATAGHSTATGPRSKVAVVRAAASRMLAVKVLIATAGVAVGGAAVAASTGALPGPAHIGGQSGARDHQLSSNSGSAGTNATASRASSSPETVPIGLCRAWASTPGPAAVRADDPAFRALIVAAGGQVAVDSYCAPVLAGASPGRASPGSRNVPAPDSPAEKVPSAGSSAASRAPGGSTSNGNSQTGARPGSPPGQAGRPSEHRQPAKPADQHPTRQSTAPPGHAPATPGSNMHASALETQPSTGGNGASSGQRPTR